MLKIIRLTTSIGMQLEEKLISGECVPTPFSQKEIDTLERRAKKILKEYKENND